MTSHMECFLFSVILAASIVSIPGCDKKQESAQSQAATKQEPKEEVPVVSAAAMMQDLKQGCPLVVQDAHVSIEEIDVGIALEFTIPDNDLSDLRQRVQTMARMYERLGKQNAMMWHQLPDAHHSDAADHQHHAQHRNEPHHHVNGKSQVVAVPKQSLPGIKAAVIDVERGARLELRPLEPSQLESLRAHVRHHYGRLHTGECWMLQEQAG